MPARSLAAEVAALRREVEQIKKGQRIAHGASIENAAVEVRDDTGSLRAIVGQQADGTTAANIVNGPVPPTPSAPTVTAELAALSVAWDGTFSDAQAAPLDWMRVEVHVGPTSGFTPDQSTLRDTIETPQGGSVIIPLPYTEWWVRLRSRTTSGVAGPATAGVAGTPRQAGAADIVAGAITADKLDAAAITGKTITGGVINGATFHSDNGAGATVDIADGSVVTTASTGWNIHVDPTQAFPVIGWKDPDGDIAGAINATGSATRSGLNISSGPFTDGAITDWRWTTFLGQTTDGNNSWQTLRLRQSDNTRWLGGTLYLDSNAARIAVQDSTSPSTDTKVVVTPGSVSVTGGTFSTSSNTTVSGILTAANIRTGNVTITPVANTPTSTTVTGLGLPGTVHRAFVTAQSSVPGTVVECTATSVTSDGLTIWVNRSNTTNTNIWYLVIAS